MSNIVLIRHVETAMAGRFCGQSDPEPNISGERQIISVLEKVRPLGIERIYASDLRRSARTAIAIGQSLGIDIELRPRLREINFGLWEGLSWNEIEKQYPAEAAQWVSEFPLCTAPGGERYPHFAARVGREFAPLLTEDGNGTSAVVTHRGVLKCVLCEYLGVSDANAWEKTRLYGAVIVATRSGGKWRVLP
jgi:broad specificity phosphatase PhoE